MFGLDLVKEGSENSEFKYRFEVTQHRRLYSSRIRTRWGTMTDKREFGDYKAGLGLVSCQGGGPCNFAEKKSKPPREDVRYIRLR